MNVKDLISNKKVVFYGDSITHNWEKYDHDLNLTRGNDYNYGLGYGHVKMLNDVCDFKSVDNFAVSGGCFANTYYLNNCRPVWRHAPHQVACSIDALKEADVVFVMLGTNDYSEQVRFGHYKDIANSFDQDDMTFHEGMNYTFDKIKQTNPNALVFVLNILFRTVDVEAHATFNFSVDEYNLAINHVCKEYGFNLIDVSKLFNKENIKNYSDDGLHPNENGYKVLTNYILEYKVK